jgi:hypothetical protein
MPSNEAAVIHFKASPDIRLEYPNKSMNLCENACCPGKNVKGNVHELNCISHQYAVKEHNPPGDRYFY